MSADKCSENITPIHLDQNEDSILSCLTNFLAEFANSTTSVTTSDITSNDVDRVLPFLNGIEVNNILNRPTNSNIQEPASSNTIASRTNIEMPASSNTNTTRSIIEPPNITSHTATIEQPSKKKKAN